jgi:hypothetical protein
MRALAPAKATIIQKRKRKDSKKSWEGTKNKKDPQAQKQAYLERLEQSPETRRTQRPGREFFSSKPAEQKYVREKSSNEKSEYRKHYSHYRKKMRVEEPQEKYSLSPHFSDAWRHEQRYSFEEGLLVT